MLDPDALYQKIKHILITTFGREEEKEASSQEFYYAFCMALREEIMLNWIKTKRSFKKASAKTVYYFSMEYLPGKLLQTNLTNLQARELVQSILKKCDRNFSDLLENDPDMGLGNGGLGRLVSCFLDSLASQKYPAMAYGLRYHYGIFEQEIWNGIQVERPDCWLLNEFPWEFRKDRSAVSVSYRGKMIPGTNSHGDQVFDIEDQEDVRALAYDIPIVGYSDNSDFSVLTLRLWSTKESPRNFELQRFNAGQLGQAGENTALTDVLYPNDNHEIGKRIRLKQEFLLVSASLQDILRRHKNLYEDMTLLPDKAQIQINDTHPALVISELVRRLVKNHDLSWKKAVEITLNTCNFTNHTILREALEEWNEKRIQELLPRQYSVIQKINEELCGQIRKSYNEEKVRSMSIIEGGQVKMAHLAIYGSKKVNGVAELHTDILKHEIFKNFYEVFPEKFVAITNGVTHRHWLLTANPLLSNFITKKIGKGWINNFLEIEKLHKFADDPESQKEFLEIKKENKKRLLDFLATENPLRDFKGKIIHNTPVLDSDALFDVQIKRFHEYKRQLLNALHLIILADEIRHTDERKVKRMVIIGGKAAPGYEMAKHIILLIFCIARKVNQDPKISEKLKIAFVENYNVSKAEIIIPAADLSQQISTAGYEASGTGNMKLAMNGALTMGTEDGANIEMRKAVTDIFWPFSFGAKAEELAAMRKNSTYKPWDIYLQNPKIKKALDTLKDGSLVKTDTEHAALCSIFENLLDGYNNSKADTFFVLNDLASFYEVQKKAEELFLNKQLWASYALHNIASMGRFSSDVVIENYSKLIWNLKKCPIDNS